MSKYHTVFRSAAGKVYTCGHGRGGRLGHGNEQTCLVIESFLYSWVAVIWQS